MKFKVQDHETLTFFLGEAEGGIVLHAMEENGNAWSVLEIQANGRVLLFNGIPDSIGLDVDSAGAINLER